jgi:prepilin-type N-terminal cleavage/methylation domain-containing protein
MAMHQDSRRPSHTFSRAFTLLELLIAIACIGLMLAILLPMQQRHRQTASLNESLDNLKQFGSLTTQYAEDNQERFATFTWRRGVPNGSQFPDLNMPFGTAIDAAAAQATDIIRRLGNRSVAETPRPANWLPHVLYTHLVLADYAKVELPWRAAVSPEDRSRICWSHNIADFTTNRCQPQPDGTEPINFRWPYSTSYETGPAFYSVDSGPNSIVNSGSHSAYVVFDASFPEQGRRTSEVAFPAQKAARWDSHQRHFGQRQPFFMADEARVPVLTVDASVRVRSGNETNRGWNPTTPTSPAFFTVPYQPAPWEPAAPPGAGSSYAGRQRFTASGLRGRDFDGDEVR